MANYNTLQKLAIQNRCRMLGCKYRGDVTRIVLELKATFPDVDNRTITPKTVTRILDKFKTQQMDGSPLIATWVIEYLIDGIRQRQVEYEDEAAMLEQNKYVHMSYCCNKKAVPHVFKDNLDETSMCTGCFKACQVYKTIDMEVLQFLRASRVEKRKDEVALAKAIEDIGYGKQSGTTQNTVQAVLPGGPVPEDRIPKHIDSTQVPDKIQDTVKDLQALSPMDRAVFVGKISQDLDDVVSGKTEIEKVNEDVTTEQAEDNSGGCE